MFTIKSIIAKDHDRSYGGYPFKVIVEVEVDAEYFKKLPIIRRIKAGPYSKARVDRDLGSLVIAVNNAVYAINNAIPALHPSIDSKGEQRSKNGIKTMIFEYFSQDIEAAKALGLKVICDQVFSSYVKLK